MNRDPWKSAQCCISDCGTRHPSISTVEQQLVPATTSGEDQVTSVLEEKK